MNARASLLIPFTLVTLGSGAADELRFDVESETTATKSFRETTEWTLDSVDFTIDGNPVAVEIPECTGKTERWVEVTDEYLEAKDGHVEELRRTFDSVGTESVFTAEGVEERHCVCASPLEEKAVVFRRNDDEYERSFDGSNADRELLEGLDADIDLLGFLPDDDVEPEDTWEVHADALARLVNPGGDMAYLPSEIDLTVASEIPHQFILGNALFNLGEAAAELDGIGKATYAGRNDDGLARIEVELELEAEVDRTERFEVFLLQELENVVTEDLELSFVIELEGEAVLLWNLEANRVESVALEADFTMDTSVTWRNPDVTFDGQPALFAVDIELGGSTIIELDVEG